jgi:hypothetical protein
MYYVVVPLSAAGNPPPTLPVMLNGVLGHALGVGLPSALFARAASASQSDSSRASTQLMPTQET